ncbi:unnamed protein product [Bemisia tabaci]|uniref:Uncharacterized protein n=1 Tax=Bemisia tabaci TaxID=7038 RepID=A0A9P0F4V6_BEMTA|nr:unnamed protein product [Bemisia tabaci]
MSSIEADPRCLRLNVLRGAQRTRCVLCPLELGVTRLSIDGRVNIFVNKYIYIPEGARSCPNHLDEYGFILEDFVPQLVYVNRPYVIQGDQLRSFMQGLRKAANAAAKISVDENSYSDDDFTVLTRTTKQQFENLYTYGDPIPIQVKNANYVRNVSQKDLLIFLCKMTYDLALAFRVLGSHISAPDLSQLFQVREVNYSLRVARPLFDNPARTSYRFHSVVVRVKRRWNLLSPGLADASLETNLFKSRVKDYVLKYYVPY